MSDKKHLDYRGEVKAAMTTGSHLYFVTVHPEGQPTAIFQFDADKNELQRQDLPCGAVALVGDAKNIFACGTDGQLYHAAKGGKPKPFGKALDAPATTMALLSQERLAVLVGRDIVILARKDGKELQKITLEENVTCIGVDPSGNWFAVGTNRGTVAVYESEDKTEFKLSDSGGLHEGAVTALLFEKDELRFFSAGADRKLLTTYARGKLEPEDKGRANNHNEPITTMTLGLADRFYTGSFDRSLKNWPREGFVKPATTQNVGRAIFLGLVVVGKKTFLVVGAADNSFRFLPIDEEGKLGDVSLRIFDAYAAAKEELKNDVTRRQTALKQLADYQDAVSIELVSTQMFSDQDHGIRKYACELIGASPHPRAPKLLEAALKHPDEAARKAGLAGLRKQLGEETLRPLDLALRTEQPDIAIIAVKALEELSKKNDQALARLRVALNAQAFEVRQAVLASLEAIYPDSPEADLMALGSSFEDLRRLALLRIYARKFLNNERVRTALRWRGEDPDQETRRLAFLLALHTRPKLVEFLRKRDPELERQLQELDKAASGKKEKDKGPEKPAEGKEQEQEAAMILGSSEQRRKDAAKLERDDYEPLLQATASRALDTCLRGARGMAVLGDVRTFGLLLQLSRENDTNARVQVCLAMGALDDERSINRLRSMLYDNQAPVRDAAFTSLAHLYHDQPLRAASAGLNSAFEDVRMRGLQVLLKQVREKPPKEMDAPEWQMVVRALNDSFPRVRSETCKACLNLKIGEDSPEVSGRPVGAKPTEKGGKVGIATLRFILQSVHADVRLEVLTEVMGKLDEPWAWPLVYEFFNDPDPGLRSEAFDFATKKRKDVDTLREALLSQYIDVRLSAVMELTKKHSKKAQGVLVEALADKDKAIRRVALDSLVADNVQSGLEEALAGPHDDVRVRAATALAKQGNEAALQPLLSLATAPKPEKKERVADWQTLVEQSLQGLAELGSPKVVTDLLPLLQSWEARHRHLAARALVWCSRAENLDPLRPTLQHNDEQVKYLAALGLAFGGDPLGASLVFSQESTRFLTPEERLVASLTLGQMGEDQLVVFLDDNDHTLQQQALLLLMLLELKENNGSPTRCLAALSSRLPRVRLTAAQVLETFAYPENMLKFVVNLVNVKADAKPWTISEDEVDLLANIIAFATPHIRARTAMLLKYFSMQEQDPWNEAWGVHRARFAKEIEKLQEQVKSRKPVPSVYTPEQLQELAFGAYVGLIREQGGADSSSQAVRIRQSALKRLLALANQSEAFSVAVRPVFIQAMADPNKDVRMLAFEQLQTLGMDNTALGAEALEAGHLDLGVKGLELLSAGASSKEGQAALQSVMLNRTDNLAQEAAKLLVPQVGKVTVAGQALDAQFKDMRRRAIAWLVEEYDEDDKAKEQLRQALNSRFPGVRNRSAVELARKKDKVAFDVLVEWLHNAENANQQQNAIDALRALEDPRSPGAFLDRLENDPAGTALAGQLIQGAGSYRNPDVVERLLDLAEQRPNNRYEALMAVHTISGHDQYIEDYEGTSIDEKWLEKQHPRHDGVLAQLIERCFILGHSQMLNQLMHSAQWSRSNKVDTALALLLNHPDDNLRNQTVSAFAWRLRKRKCSPEPLRKALANRDPISQFIAAEGLARGGYDDGLNVLMASIEFQSDWSLRERAVMALGELADPRALDVLLKLAGDDGHELQECAAEALGHMGKSPKADEIFQLLSRMARGYTHIAIAALKGLRWFDSKAGWKIIRERADDQNFYSRVELFELLGHNDEPATRDLLLKLLKQENETWSLRNLMKSARMLWGSDSFEPDYALIQNTQNSIYDAWLSESLKRVCEKGDPKQLLLVLPNCQQDVQERLASSLLNRVPAPLAEAREALTGNHARSVEVASHLLGRAGKEAADCGPALEAALERWTPDWQNHRQQLVRRNRQSDMTLDQITGCLRSLLWSASRIGVAAEGITKAAAANPEDRAYRPIRLDAIVAFGEFDSIPKQAAEVLEKAATGDDAHVRTVAAELLAKHDAQQASALAERLLSDRISFNHLAAQEGVDVTDTLQKAVSKVEYQGVAVPELVERKDIEALMGVVGQSSLPETVRLGAIEGLAAMADTDAEAKLVEIGTAQGENEELRKAAWRGLRRSKRKRKKLEGTAAEAS